MEQPSVIPVFFEEKKDNYPFPAPFILSSVERDWCSGDKSRENFIKRRHLEENLKTIAGKIGMNETMCKSFLDYWCSPSNRSQGTLRAELDECFNLRLRAENWAQREKNTQFVNSSRIDKYAEATRQFISRTPGQDLLYRTLEVSTRLGNADTPDEQ